MPAFDEPMRACVIEHREQLILDYLAASPGFRSNEAILGAALNRFGVVSSWSDVRTALRQLEQLCKVRTLILGRGLMVVDLTQHGQSGARREPSSAIQEPTATGATRYSVPMGDPLDMLVEECAEVVQEYMKMRRFGAMGTPEWIAADNQTPRQRLAQEIGDVLAVIEILERSSSPQLMLRPHELADAKARKLAKLKELFGYEHAPEAN